MVELNSHQAYEQTKSTRSKTNEEPTAIFACNDILFGVMQAMKETGAKNR